MKVLIVFTSLLAIAFASYQQHYPINIPIIGKTGVPLESPEIVHARHAHLSHVAAVKSHQGSGYYGLGEGYAGGYAGYAGGYAGVGGYAGGYDGGYGKHYPINIPVIGKTGVPLESAEIVHARQAHLAQVAAVRSKQGQYYGGYAGGYAGAGLGYGGAHYGGAYALPVIGHGGVPIDTPEVQAAKAAHFAAHAKASSGYGHYRKRRSIGGYAGYGGYYGGHGGYYGGYPALAHDGQPIKTPEVQALEHKHFAAHAEARARVGGGYLGGYGGGYGAYGGYGGEYGAYGAGGYGHGIHIPIIGPKGVPIDTPEVQHAREAHFAALAKAASRASYGGSEYGQYY